MARRTQPAARRRNVVGFHYAATRFPLGLADVVASLRAARRRRARALRSPANSNQKRSPMARPSVGLGGERRVGRCLGCRDRWSGRTVQAWSLSLANRSSGHRAEADSGWPAGSTWCSRVGLRAVEACRRGPGRRRRSISAGRRRGLAPVRRRGARTGGAGRLPRVAPRSRQWQAGRDDDHVLSVSFMIADESLAALESRASLRRRR